MPTEADLRQALRDCFDPVEHRDVVALNLVRSATLVEDTESPGAGIPGVPARFIARIVLTEPSTDDARNEILASIVRNRLLGLPWISRVDLRMQPNPLPILK
jgi:metal-sulfur cluster biosynthetic enzyme